MTATIHFQAACAIRAARNRNTWGRYATYRYLRMRGIPDSLYVLARVLESARAGVTHN